MLEEKNCGQSRTTRRGFQKPLGSSVVSRSLLSFRGVSLDLDGCGVRGVTFDLHAGEVGVLFGGRGATKGALLRLAGGMLDADVGRVLVDGQELRLLGDVERSRVLAGQVAWACRTGPGALRVSVRDYVCLPLVSAGAGWKEAGERARQALERLGVHECADLRWAQLSGWQRMCVELAQAVARQPSLLLVEELVDGLSMSGVREAMRLLRGLADEGMGVLLTADDMETAVLGDRLWRVEAGEVSEIGGGEAGSRSALPGWRRRRVS